MKEQFTLAISFLNKAKPLERNLEGLPIEACIVNVSDQREVSDFSVLTRHINIPRYKILIPVINSVCKK